MSQFDRRRQLRQPSPTRTSSKHSDGLSACFGASVIPRSATGLRRPTVRPFEAITSLFHRAAHGHRDAPIVFYLTVQNGSSNTTYCADGRNSVRLVRREQ